MGACLSTSHNNNETVPFSSEKEWSTRDGGDEYHLPIETKSIPARIEEYLSIFRKCELPTTIDNLNRIIAEYTVFWSGIQRIYPPLIKRPLRSFPSRCVWIDHHGPFMIHLDIELNRIQQLHVPSPRRLKKGAGLKWIPGCEQTFRIRIRVSYEYEYPSRSHPIGVLLASGSNPPLIESVLVDERYYLINCNHSVSIGTTVCVDGNQYPLIRDFKGMTFNETSLITQTLLSTSIDLNDEVKRQYHYELSDVISPLTEFRTPRPSDPCLFLR
jgi:hypothetical protein